MRRPVPGRQERTSSDLRAKHAGHGSYSGRVSPLSPDLFLAAGGDVPPPLTVTRILTAWTVDPWLAAVIVAVGGLYLYGVSTLTRGVTSGRSGGRWRSSAAVWGR